MCHSAYFSLAPLVANSHLHVKQPLNAVLGVIGTHRLASGITRLTLMFVMAFAFGYFYSDYSAPFAFIVKIILVPLSFAILALAYSNSLYIQIFVGFLCITLMNALSWHFWVEKVGIQFAVSDEQTYGMSRITYQIQIFTFLIAFGTGKLILRFRKE